MMKKALLHLLCLCAVLPGITACPSKAGPDSTSRDHSWIHLFVDPAAVEQYSRFSFRYEKAGEAAALRREENLDDIVAGAGSDQQRCELLMHWVRKQWELSRPDPYPPPDARIILRDIRSGLTGGFCGQYTVVLVQAAASFGMPARFVTLYGHEVTEIWLRDENRWILFDPYNDMTVADEGGNLLNAGQIHAAVADGRTLQFSEPNSLAESPEDYLNHYHDFAVWIRNDLLAHPMNFSDFDRYRVWYDPDGKLNIPLQSLKTPYLLDLYQPPE